MPTYNDVLIYREGPNRDLTLIARASAIAALFQPDEPDLWIEDETVSDVLIGPEQWRQHFGRVQRSIVWP
jgi:hypothetical protein